ncbi:Major facilitator super domain-containing protein 12 [Homalodisca vitripennis]|nr:Major facilitator super domain-containing protein 12 [Homalodisca vitripennis]
MVFANVSQQIFPMYLHVAVVYTASQVFANVSQTIFPMYLHDDLHLGAAKIAILPFIMFTVSFIMSTIIKPLNKYCGRKVALCMGAIVGLGACVWVRFGSCHIFSRYLIYVITGMYGVAISTLMVTSLGITADFIGQDLDNGAFVYGIVSFCDKVTCGVLIMIIQAW